MATTFGPRERQLLSASERGDVKSVRALLARKDVDVNACDSMVRGLSFVTRWTSHWMLGADFPSIEMCMGHLVGATFGNRGLQFKVTPLHKAASNGSWQIVELLLSAGGNCDATDAAGETPLHRASYRCHERVVELLLKAGANRNAATKTGRTPLHNVCSSCKSVPARILLEAGADHDVTDHLGLKPLHLCLHRRAIPVDDETLRTLQVLVTFGAMWDDKCDKLIREEKLAREAPALRTCVELWTLQHAQGIPLTQVQLEVVSRGPQAVEAFVKEYARSTKINHRRKICVVGPSNAGKTSLIKSVVSNVSNLEHPDQRTIGVDQFKLGFTMAVDGAAVQHEVTFWDFAGQDEYQVAHSLFYSRRTLYLVCVDLEAYLLAYIQSDITNDTKDQRERMMNEFIERSVLKWVRAIFARQPDAEFVFVATKKDLLVYPTFTKELKAFLAVKLAEVQGIVRELQRELELAGESSSLPEQRKADTLTLYAYNKLIQEREELAKAAGEKVIEVAEPNAGINSRRVRLKLAWNRTWKRVISVISGRQNQDGPPMDHNFMDEGSVASCSDATTTESRSTLFISCSDKESVAKARNEIELLIHNSERSFQMPESYSSVLKTVVATRERVAKGDSGARISVVFASIAFTLESLSRQLKIEQDTVRFVLQILHDLGDVLWYEDLGVPLFQQTVILDPMLLIDFVRQVITHAHKVDVLSHTELSRLPFWIDLHDEQILAMKQMLQMFQLVHPAQGKMSWDSDLIVPAFWKAKTPASWLFKYANLRLVPTMSEHDPRRPQEKVRVHWEYMFKHEFPDALFDHLVVASYSPGKKRTAGPDWILYTEDVMYACRVMVARDVGTKQRVLQLEAVLAEAATGFHASMLWEAFEILSVAIVQVLRRYPGIVVTSTALDADEKAFRLDDLFSCRRTIEMERWMPPSTTCETYKKCATKGSGAPAP